MRCAWPSDSADERSRISLGGLSAAPQNARSRLRATLARARSTSGVGIRYSSLVFSRAPRAVEARGSARAKRLARAPRARAEPERCAQRVGAGAVHHGSTTSTTLRTQGLSSAQGYTRSLLRDEFSLPGTSRT